MMPLKRESLNTQQNADTRKIYEIIINIEEH